MSKAECWAITNLIMFNKTNRWILHMEWGGSGCKYRQSEVEDTETSPMERTVGVLADGMLDLSQQRSLAAKGQRGPLRSIRPSTATWLGVGLSHCAL